MTLKKSLYIFLIILTITLTLGDTITTLLCVQNGATELNPIANFLIENHLFVVVKILTAFGLSWGIFEASKMDKMTKIIVYSLSVIISATMLYATIFNLIGLANR